MLQGVEYCAGPYDCVDGTDALVIATEWQEFRALDLKRLHDLVACPVIVDLRNVYRVEDMNKHGFAYSCLGRPVTKRCFPLDASLERLMSLAKARRSLPACKGGKSQ